ncbi:hypothetical protein ACFYXJ_12305 [Streptomyces sp. NPDC002667]|uniref:hypothetical protein n=1 Tax=Streptomyces sp. NPDC002667 TaxID=3364657 RepID=UPI00369CA7DC
MIAKARTIRPVRALRSLFARRARPKRDAPERTVSSGEAVPNSPDVWLAALRLWG